MSTEKTSGKERGWRRLPPRPEDLQGLAVDLKEAWQKSQCIADSRMRLLTKEWNRLSMTDRQKVLDLIQGRPSDAKSEKANTSDDLRPSPKRTGSSKAKTTKALQR